MSTTQRVGVAVVALGLVGLGVFLLTSNGEAPQPPSEAPRAPVVVAPPRPTTPDDPVRQAPSAPVAVAPSTPSTEPAAPPAPAPPPVEYAPSPFETSSSAELEYATKLVIGEKTGPTEWMKAVEVFQRCLDQNPKNHLCKRGVYAAWERIDSDGGMPRTNLTVQQLQPDLTARPDGIVAPALELRRE